MKTLLDIKFLGVYNSIADNKFIEVYRNEKRNTS